MDDKDKQKDKQIRAMIQAINNIYEIVVDIGDETSEKIRKITEDIMDNHFRRIK